MKRKHVVMGFVLLLVLLVLVWLTRRPTPFEEPVTENNPTRIEFYSEDHDTVSYYEYDTINEAGQVVQTILIPKEQTTVNNADGLISAPVFLLPLTPGGYTSRIRAVVETAEETPPEPPLSPVSPDGTTVPPADQIVDDELHVWTLTSAGNVLQDGVDTGGSGTTILWSGGEIYVEGGDGTWYHWWGGGYEASSPPAFQSRRLRSTTLSTGNFARSVDSEPSNRWARTPIACY